MQFTAVVVSAHIPSCDAVNIGVDQATDSICLRFRPDFDLAGPSADLDVILHIPAMLKSMSAEGGAQDVLDWLGGTASNAIRVSDPLIIEASDADQAADRLYRAHIDKEHDA
jgi:hypothetical protein